VGVAELLNGPPTDRLVKRSARRIAAGTSGIVGSSWAFIFAVTTTVAWLIWGVFDSFSDRWLLVPSALASVVTLLIAFGLQYSQNRDTRAIQLKLDEILRVSSGARNELVKLERLPDEHLAMLEDQLLESRSESRDAHGPHQVYDPRSAPGTRSRRAPPHEIGPQQLSPRESRTARSPQQQ
jgi:low affinity Fe/Cu permease